MGHIFHVARERRAKAGAQLCPCFTFYVKGKDDPRVRGVLYVVWKEDRKEEEKSHADRGGK